MIAFQTKELWHAETVLENLFRKRFFLDREENYRERFAAFPRLVGIQEGLIQAYRNAEESAAQSIRNHEQTLGLDDPEIPKDSKLVRAGLYGSGFDVTGIFPLSFFVADFNPDALHDELIAYFQSNRPNEDLSPREIQKINDSAGWVRQGILRQFGELSARDDFDSLSVVLMKSKFRLSSYGPDLAQEKLDWIKKYPLFLAHIFHRAAKNHRFVDHNYILFDTLRATSPVMSHWNGQEASVSYDSDGGYDCFVYFAAIM